MFRVFFMFSVGQQSCCLHQQGRWRRWQDVPTQRLSSDTQRRVSGQRATFIFTTIKTSNLTTLNRPGEMWWHMRRNQISSFGRNGRVHLNRPGGVSSVDYWPAEVCASAVVMLDTPCSEVVWRVWLPTAFANFPFTYPPVRHRVPSHFSWSLLSL